MWWWWTANFLCHMKIYCWIYCVLASLIGAGCDLVLMALYLASAARTGPVEQAGSSWVPEILQNVQFYCCLLLTWWQWSHFLTMISLAPMLSMITMISLTMMVQMTLMMTGTGQWGREGRLVNTIMTCVLSPVRCHVTNDVSYLDDTELPAY